MLLGICKLRTSRCTKSKHLAAVRQTPSIGGGVEGPPCTRGRFPGAAWCGLQLNKKPIVSCDYAMSIPVYREEPDCRSSVNRAPAQQSFLQSERQSSRAMQPWLDRALRRLQSLNTQWTRWPRKGGRHRPSVARRQLHRQPTPRSVAQGKEKAAADERKDRALLDRARTLAEQGDEAGCAATLAKVCRGNLSR